ncbi:hypothetical protein ScalyP_jg2112 [Parmales sp. scaly parma]|nr:hypothetical protein ScalyP_jg2112 [Parmales sp. scaly parma]
MSEEFDVEMRGDERGDEKDTTEGMVTVKRKVWVKALVKSDSDGKVKVQKTVLVMKEDDKEVHLVSGEATGEGERGGLVLTLGMVVNWAIREPAAIATATMESSDAGGGGLDGEQTGAAIVQFLRENFEVDKVHRRVLKFKANLSRFLGDKQVEDWVRGYENDMRAFIEYIMEGDKVCSEFSEFFGNENTTTEGWGGAMRGALHSMDACGFEITKIYLKNHEDESNARVESTEKSDGRETRRGDPSQGGKVSLTQEGAWMKKIEKNVMDEGNNRVNEIHFLFEEFNEAIGQESEGEELTTQEVKRVVRMIAGMTAKAFAPMGSRVLQLVWTAGTEQEVTSIAAGIEKLYDGTRNCLHLPPVGEVSISAIETRTVARNKMRQALMSKMSSQRGGSLSQAVKWFAKSLGIATHLGMTLTIEDLIAFIDLNLFPDNAGQDGGNLRNYRARYVEEAMKAGMIESENGVIIVTWPDQEGVENEKDGRKKLKDLVEDLSMKWEAIIVKTSEVWFRKRSTGERTWSEVNRPADGGACRKPFKIQDLLELVGKPGVEPIGEPSGNERKGGNKKNGNGRNNNNDKDNIEKREMCAYGLKHTFLGPCELVKNVVEKFREGCPDAVLSQMNRRGSPFISPPAGSRNAESQEQKIRRKKILLSNYSQGTRATQRNVNGRIVNKLFNRSTEYVAQDMVDDFTKMSYCSYCGYHLWKNGEGSETGHTDACCPMMTTGAEKAGFNPQYQITLN